MIPDEATFALCAAQHGVIARHQLLPRLDEQAADDLLRRGPFERAIHGVYRLRGTPVTPERTAFAAALRARPTATVTGPVALRLLGVPSFLDANAFEILVRPGRRLSNVDFPHRVDPVPDRPVTRYGQVRVAGPLDALIDTAHLLGGGPDRDLRVAWDHLRGKGLIAPERLQRRIDELRTQVAGAAILEALLRSGGGLAVESEGERALFPALSCFGDAFEPQVWVIPRRRLDFYCRRCRYGCEYVGEVDHAYLEQRIADDQRDDELRREGIRIRYVTKHDLRDPVAFVASLASSLTVRAHELGVLPPALVRPAPVA